VTVKIIVICFMVSCIYPYFRGACLALLNHRLPYSILPDLPSDFHSFGFHNNNSFIEKRVTSFASSPTPKPGGLLFVFMSHSDRMAQLYPWALRSLFVSFNDFQDYGGGILTLLHVE
jgi:hypothetical protein